MIMLSPGVYTQEEDFSLYARRLATSIFGLVTTATKGPVNQIQLVTDVAQLNSYFGPPSYPHYGLYAAEAYLRTGRQLKLVRVATYDQTATCDPFGDGASGTAFTAYALSSGSWSNKISVSVDSGYVSDTYKISILYDGKVREVYDRVRIGSANKDHQDYIETRINGVSQYISVTADEDATAIETGVTHSFSGGDDGAPADLSDVIGVQGEPPLVPTTGLQLFADPLNVDVNILAAPGYWQDSVNRAIIKICEDRKDCLGLLSMPDNLTLMQAVDWHNGDLAGDDYPSAAYDTSYAAVFYPWIQIMDAWNNSQIWVPPEGHIAQRLAYTDEVADPWWSPAGLNRGILSDVLDVRVELRRGELDYMYSGGNALNMIVKKPNAGIVVMGQRTLSRKPSALDRINVRRLLCYVEKVVATVVDYLVHEPNDRFTWLLFTDYVTPVLETIKSRRGIEDYRVVCDETTNTPDVIDNNEMHGRIFLRPTKAAEFIGVTFTVVGGAVSFEELV